MVEILGGLLIGTAVSGIVPVLNAELLVVGVVIAAPEIGLPLIAMVSAAGQMVTKTALFSLARWAPHRLTGKAKAALDKATEAVGSRGGAATGLVFASAVTGLPPFFGVSLAAGAVGMRLRSFLASGGGGRLLRFAIIAWAAREMGGGTLGELDVMASLAAAIGG